MPQQVKIKAILKTARLIRSAWESNPDFQMGEIHLNDFISICEAAEGLARQYARKRIELTGVRANRDSKVQEVSDLMTRFRSGVRGHYGPDSVQYEQSGATRDSMRKPRKRKSKE